jgi:hypothetical protein
LLGGSKFRSLIRAMASRSAGVVRQAVGVAVPADLFQLDGIFIIQASGDAVEDEDRQQAQDILDSAHDDSLKIRAFALAKPEKWDGIKRTGRPARPSA